MSNIKTETCPHCGNIVEGRKIKSYTNKVTRQGAKTAVHMATSAGGMATGAAVGSAILPGVGTLVGGALGFIGSAMFNQKVNEGIDKVGDSVEDELLTMNYEFRCPKCGHTWTYQESEIPDAEEDDEDENEDENTDYEPIDYTAYTLMKEHVAIEYYCLCLLNNQSDKNVNLNQIVNKVKADTGIEIYDWQIKSDKDNGTYEKLKSLLFAKFISTNQWHNIITTLPHEKITDKFIMNVGGSCNLTGAGYVILGAVVSGTVSKGDTVVICTDADEYYKAQVTDIEMLNKFLDTAQAGDTLGLGVNFDLSTLSGNIECILRFDELDVKEDDDTENDDNKQSSEIADSEQEYLDELKEILADGEISPRERRLLDKIRNKLGISEERAAELEASLSSSSLTAEEQEYLDEYKEIISEGEISARDQRFLDKLKKANNISEERAKEIERLAD